MKGDMAPMKKRQLLFVGAELAPFNRLQSEASVLWNVVAVPDSRGALAALPKVCPDVLLAHLPSNEDRWSLFRHTQELSPKTLFLAVGDGRGAAPFPAQWVHQEIDFGSLESHLERAKAVEEVTRNLEVARIAGGLQSLPSVPKTYQALTEAVTRSDTSVGDIAKIVQSDPALSLQVLHLVNSAFFGLSRRVTSIAEAVAFLGVEQLKALVLVSQVFSAVELTPNRFFSLEAFQRNAVRVAKLARWFVGDRSMHEAAFTAGILLDVGKIVLGLREPERFERALERTTQTGEPPYVAERELIGVSHSEVGAYLLAAWQIPFPVVECVAFHHEPSESGGSTSRVLAAVHAADALVGIVARGEPETSLDLRFLERCGALELLPGWRKQVEELLADAS